MDWLVGTCRHRLLRCAFLIAPRVEQFHSVSQRREPFRVSGGRKSFDIFSWFSTLASNGRKSAFSLSSIFHFWVKKRKKFIARKKSEVKLIWPSNYRTENSAKGTFDILLILFFSVICQVKTNNSTRLKRLETDNSENRSACKNQTKKIPSLKNFHKKSPIDLQRESSRKFVDLILPLWEISSCEWKPSQQSPGETISSPHESRYHNSNDSRRKKFYFFLNPNGAHKKSARIIWPKSEKVGGTSDTSSLCFSPPPRRFSSSSESY